MCWPLGREQNVLEAPKLVGRLFTLRTIMHTSFEVKCQRSRSPGRLMLRPEVHHIFRMGRPMNFKLGTQNDHEDPHHQQAPDLKGHKSRSQGHVTRLTGVG